MAWAKVTLKRLGNNVCVLIVNIIVHTIYKSNYQLNLHHRQKMTRCRLWHGAYFFAVAVKGVFQHSVFRVLQNDRIIRLIKIQLVNYSL